MLVPSHLEFPRSSTFFRNTFNALRSQLEQFNGLDWMSLLKRRKMKRIDYILSIFDFIAILVLKYESYSIFKNIFIMNLNMCTSSILFPNREHNIIHGQYFFNLNTSGTTFIIALCLMFSHQWQVFTDITFYMYVQLTMFIISLLTYNR